MTTSSLATRLASTLGVVSLVGSAMVGCADEPPAAQEQPAIQQNEIILSYNGDIGLLGSYHELFDTSTDTPCVEYEGELGATATQPRRVLEIEMVRDKKELARELGIDLNAKARYGGLSANAAMNLVDEFSSSANSITFLLRAEADYVVRDVAGPGNAIVFTEQGENAMAEGPAEFVRKCGTHYANGVRYGSRFYLMVTLHASSHSAKTQLEASLTGEVPGASGSMAAQLSKAASVSGVRAELDYASTNFWLNDQASGAAVKAISEMDPGKLCAKDEADCMDMFRAAALLYAAMAEQVHVDYCRDGGAAGQEPGPPADTDANDLTAIPACPVASEGYFTRQTSRAVAVTGLQLADYQGIVTGNEQPVPATNDWNEAAPITNALSPQHDNMFTTIRSRLAYARSFLRDYSALSTVMDSIYHGDLVPYFDAQAGPNGAHFNIAPPGQARRLPGEVHQVAMEVDEAIRPLQTGSPGTLRSEVDERINHCLDLIKTDIMGACTRNDSYHLPGSDAPAPTCSSPPDAQGNPAPECELEADHTEEYWALKSYLDDYINTKRIVPLSLAIGEPSHHDSAVYECQHQSDMINLKLQQAGSETQIHYRLANEAEMAWLMPVLSNGNVDWSEADFPFSTWYASGPHDCADDYPYVMNEPLSSQSHKLCSENDWNDDHLAVLCVPGSGPTPALPPL